MSGHTHGIAGLNVALPQGSPARPSTAGRPRTQTKNAAWAEAAHERKRSLRRPTCGLAPTHAPTRPGIDAGASSGCEAVHLGAGKLWRRAELPHDHLLRCHCFTRVRTRTQSTGPEHRLHRIRTLRHVRVLNLLPQRSRACGKRLKIFLAFGLVDAVLLLVSKQDGMGCASAQHGKRSVTVLSGNRDDQGLSDAERSRGKAHRSGEWGVIRTRRQPAYGHALFIGRFPTYLISG